jgi:DNA modification methylase
LKYNEIICSDSLKALKKFKGEFVHLTFTSPPFNAKIKYGSYNDNLPYDKYLKWLKDIFIEIYRITVVGGRCVINIDAIKNQDKEISDTVYRIPIYVDIYNMMKEIGWLFFDEIFWSKQYISGNKSSWGSWMSCSCPCIRRSHEYILVFSKKKWKLDGDSELSDMTDEEFKMYTDSVWQIYPGYRRLGNHPAIFPEELAKRVIKLYSYRDNVVLDPFSGSGTVPYVAKSLCRQYIGIDNDKGYCEYAEGRVEQVTLFEDNYTPRSDRLKPRKKKDKIDLWE